MEGLPPPSWVRPAPVPDPDWTVEPGDVFLFGRNVAGASDWHVDPVHGVRWPRRRLTRRIPISGPDSPGDVQYVWGPSRFGQLFDLCHAPGGGPAAAAQVDSWIRQNPARLGIHWHNALNASLRAIAWIHADGVLAAREDAAWCALRPRVLAALGHHGGFIERNLPHGTFNHLVGDAAALAILGASYPSMPGGARWRELGVSILRDEIGRQVLPDGSHAELAPAYARFVADLYLLAGMVVGDDELLHAAQRLLETLARQATPDGDLPGCGDDDGGMVLWTCRAEERLCVSLLLGAVVLNRPDFAYVAGLSHGMARARRVVERLVGPDRLRTLVAQPPEETSALFSDAGVAVYRSDWTRDAVWALFRCGPMGVTHGAHAHADLLQVLTRGGGRAPLVDPGTPTYNGDDALRWRSTSTAWHNTVSVDGRSQAERTGRFHWRRLAEGEDLRVRAEGARWEAAGSVRYGAVTHERTVTVAGGTLAIEDRVDCAGAHEVSASLLFGDGAIALEHSGWERVEESEATFSPIYGAGVPGRRRLLSARMKDRFFGRIELRP